MEMNKVSSKRPIVAYSYEAQDEVFEEQFQR